MRFRDFSNTCGFGVANFLLKTSCSLQKIFEVPPLRSASMRRIGGLVALVVAILAVVGIT